MNLANITTLAALAATADVTIETTTFTLTVGDDAVARSLVVKTTGEETLAQRERIALFSSTQTRPFNNEIKLTRHFTRIRRGGADGLRERARRATRRQPPPTCRRACP